MNERVLRFRDIRVIDADGSQLGIILAREALAMAREQGLDLVMIAQNAQPPVCRIIDYGKHKYELEKREKENKRKAQDVKGIKIRPNIAENDLNIALRNARRFLEDGDKVRVICQFRARELAHPEIGQRKMLTFAERLADIGVVEKSPSLDGRQIVMVLNPKPGASSGGKKKDAENQNAQDRGEAVQDHGVGEDHAPEEREQPHVLPQEPGSTPSA